jgi:hypothetical protein
MKFNDLVKRLHESVSPLRTFYHISEIQNIGNIIKSDIFRLSPIEEIDDITSHFEGYSSYMSTARTPSSHYIQDFIKNSYPVSSCIIELDASKLSDKGYKIVPFNYYDFVRTSENKKLNNLKEQEDRLLSKKEYIPDFSQYIKAFHICNEAINFASFKPIINSLYETRKPVYIYDTKEDLKILNRRKRKIMNEPLY